MKIIINEKKSQELHRICIPRCFCSFSINCMIRALKSKSVKGSADGKTGKILSKQQYRDAKRMLKKLNKNYKGLEIISIDTDTEIVRIII